MAWENDTTFYVFLGSKELKTLKYNWLHRICKVAVLKIKQTKIESYFERMSLVLFSQVNVFIKILVVSWDCFDN